MASLPSPSSATAASAAPADVSKKSSKASKRLLDESRRAQLDIETEVARAQAVAASRWTDCLRCLQSAVPILHEQPWRMIHDTAFTADAFDALTETLSGLSQKTNSGAIDDVRSVLQKVYLLFIDLGNFAKHQPAFVITADSTLKRLIRILDQTGHAGSDKSLFPNILLIFQPTIERDETHQTLIKYRFTEHLLNFARDSWTPQPITFQLIMTSLERMSQTADVRAAVRADGVAYSNLCALAYAHVDGISDAITPEQREAAQRALALYDDAEQVGTANALDEQDDQDDAMHNNTNNAVDDEHDNPQLLAT